MKTKSIPAFLLLLVLTANAYGQAAKQLLSVPTIADLEMRIPQAGEVVEVRNGSASNLWAAPRTFTYRTNTETADRVYVVTNRVAGTRYVATDRDNGVCDLSLWATGDGTTDDTARILQAVALMQDGYKLYSPPGKRYRVSSTIAVTNSRVTVDFNGSSLVSVITDRSPALRIGPAQINLSGMDFALSTSTNRATGVPAGTFTAGDMVLLYNLIQNPADYYPGQFAFVDSASGTEMTLDRFPDDALQVTNATRFVSPPDAVTIRNLAVDLSGATDGIGISAIGRGHLVENCRVTGTGTTNDPNYIGIELRGQSIVARNNYVRGILDYGNADDKAGYGIFMAGDSISLEHNEIHDCKHTISTSERRAKSTRLRMSNNLCRQRGDWEGLTDSIGDFLFMGNLDVHANVKNALIQGNYCESWGRWNAAIRNGDFDLIDNYFVIHDRAGLSFNQQQLGFNEAITTRGVIRGNHFITPDDALTFYFGHRGSGYMGTHSNLLVEGNTFDGGVLTFQDYTGTNSNPFDGVVLKGNIISRRSLKTPLVFLGTMKSFLVSGNIIRFGTNGNGITVAADGESTNREPARQLHIAGNFFDRAEGGTGWDVNVISGPTNIVSLGENRWSKSWAGYIGPINGMDSALPVGMYNSRDTYPRIIGTHDGKLKFGSGETYPYSSISLLYPGALQTDGIWTMKTSDGSSPALGTYIGSFSNYWNWVVRGDGLMAYRYLDTDSNLVSTPIVLGPRRESDLVNGVWRLSGVLGLTEHAEPIVPETTTATLWLASASPTNRDIRIVWPDGLGGKVDGKVWHQYSDGSGSGLDADLLDGQSSADFQTALSFTNGVTNSAGVVSLAIAPGSNVTLSTNAGTVTINSSGGGGVGDVTLAGTNAFTGENSFSGLTTISNLSVPGVLSVGSITSGSALGMAIGGTGGTNAASARASLGVTYDVDVQAYRLGLLQAALALTADGHMVYHNGTLVTNLASTAAGRALLTAASASAQWNNYLLSVASTNGGYDSTSWDGVTDRLVTLDQFRDAINALPGGSNAITSVTAPLSLTNGVLSIDTTGLGGGGSGGYTYLVTNSLGAWQGRDSSTNWTILSTTISSNDVPTATGRFLDGGWSLVASNNSGSSATAYLDVSVGGSLIFRDSYSWSSGAGVAQRPMAAQFWLVRESASTASLIQIGQNANSSSTPIGHGDFGSTANSVTIVVTNISVNWSSNVAFSIAISCDTSTSTNAALGIRVVNAWLRKEAATSTGGGSIAADGTAVTNIVSSPSITNTVVAGQTTLSVIGAGVTGINADNIASGTLASNRLPSAISLTTLSAGTLTATSVSGNGSGLTNLQTSVTNPVNNEVVSATVLNNAIANIAGGVVYGSTNASGINTNYLSFSDTVPADWSQTYSSIASGETLVGGWQITNQQTRIAKGQYVHTVFIAATGIGGPTLTYRSDLYKITATNETLLDTGSSVPLTLSVTNECRTISYLPTNVPLAAGEYLAVKRYVTRSGGSSANVTIHGGTATPTRLETPALSLSSDYVSKSGDTMTGALTNTVRIGAPALFAGTTNVADALALKAPLASPTLASPTLNDTVTYEQTVLSAHSSVTNFVADPTVSPYQTINADLTTPFATVGFLHATNVAAGRQTTILVFAGTNASVTVSLAAQFARNTNSVSLTTGQILPISFYGYGSNPTNVIATMGTAYTR